MNELAGARKGFAAATEGIGAGEVDLDDYAVQEQIVDCGIRFQLFLAGDPLLGGTLADRDGKSAPRHRERKEEDRQEVSRAAVAATNDADPVHGFHVRDAADEDDSLAI